MYIEFFKFTRHMNSEIKVSTNSKNQIFPRSYSKQQVFPNLETLIITNSQHKLKIYPLKKNFF